MIKIAHWVVTMLILLLGAVHIGIGFYCRQVSEDTLWFIGAGVAILFAGLFNLLMNVVTAKPACIITLIVNAATLGLFVYAIQVLAGVQVYIGIGLFASATVLAFIRQAT